MLLPTTERADVIAAVGTNGVNCGIGPGYIVEWLETLHRAAPFVLTIVGSDILAGRFCSDIPETAHWARRMYAFCPDIVDQGTGTVESLADGLKESRELFFWWD